MATAQEVETRRHALPEQRPGLVAALVEERLSHDRTGFGAWADAGRIGQQAGVEGRGLESEIRLAEQRGLVEVKSRSGQTMLVLTPLGSSLYGVDGPTRGAWVADEAVEGLPSPDLVALLARWPSSFPAVEDLANHLGQDVEDLWEEFQEAERSGVVSLWPDHPAGPAVMLSSWSASTLGLRLASDGSRWLGRRDQDPTSIDPQNRFRIEADLDLDPTRPDFLDDYRDPGAFAGDETLEATEAVARLSRDVEDAWSDQDDGSGPKVLVEDRELSFDERWEAAERDQAVVRLPRPRLLLGQRLTWPVLTPGAEPPRIWCPGDGPCPACFGGPVAVATYCLVCHRSGLDPLIREMIRREGGRAKGRRQDQAKPSRALKAGKRQVEKVQALRGGIGS